MRLCTIGTIILAALATFAGAASRKKRFLVFPTNSALSLSACLAKGGLLTVPPVFVFTFDFDLLFQLPNSTRVWKGIGPYQVLRREKRDLYLGMEEILEKQGLSGRPCVLRALCEARQILGEGGGLMEDIFHTMFTLEPKDGESWDDEADWDLREHDNAHALGASRFPCHQLYSACPVSLLHYALW